MNGQTAITDKAEQLSLVADIGGTNSRFALANDSGLMPDTVQSFANADFDRFEDVLAAFLRAVGLPDLARVCIAVAGPVSKNAAALTNRSWRLERDSLSRLTGTSDITLINDLEALGHTVGLLSEDDVRLLSGLPIQQYRNTQCLIVGIGTGLNVCAIKFDSAGTAHVLQAEMGHASLPASVLRVLQKTDAIHTADFDSAESLFSGAGLSRLYEQLVGGKPLPPQHIADAAHLEGDADALKLVSKFQTLIGVFCKELSYQYLPMSGIFLAGSVSRGILGQGTVDAFLSAYRSHGVFQAELANIPISLITKDEAALIGCLRTLT